MFDRLFDIIERWDPLCQGIFLLIVLSMLIGLICYPLKMAGVLVRGWPPQAEPDDEDVEAIEDVAATEDNPNG